jgi:hypothetical protein
MMNNFTNIQTIIEGCLLGDGHLELHENSKNASFTYCSSSEQHARFIHQFFINYCSDNYSDIKRREIFDKRTEKTYVNYSFKTKALPIFTEQYYRFYNNKIKIIPMDVEIDGTSLLLWYVGDGELDSRYGYIKLHTNSFTYDEVVLLCNKLFQFDAKPLKKTNNQYLISVPRKKVKSFLSYIGKCPIDDYKHKWNEIPYRNKNIEKDGIKFYDGTYPLIVKDFISGRFTIYELHKKYNTPIKGIKNHFNKNNINWTPIDNKKKIIQCDLNNNVIFVWNSGQEINKKLKYNASAISECCRGIRKQYKSYIWKFK